MEPQHIKEILPEVMKNIKERCNEYRKKHNQPLLETHSEAIPEDLIPF